MRNTEKQIIILKFGGTSVSTKNRLQTICDIVHREKENKPVIVVSAIRGVTDLLLLSVDASLQERRNILVKVERIHVDLIRDYWGNADVSEISTYLTTCLNEIESILRKKERNKAISDLIVSYGEKISSFIISKAIESSGIPSEQVVATKLIVTDANFGNADFLPEESTAQNKKVLLPLFRKNIVPVVSGFIGATEDGETTTLGRGGSDYSAAIIGYCLGATEIQIWTDVDGIYSADPRLVSTASLLTKVSYREASELAAFGAKVLHPRTIRPAITSGIPVRVLNTLNPDGQGTVIVEERKKQRVAAIASKQKTVLVNLYSTEMLLSKGFLVRIFSVFAKHNISIDLVSVSEVSVSVTLDNNESLAKAVKELEEFTTVSIREVGIVSIVGDGIIEVDGIMKNIFSVLDFANIPVHMISLGASDINISLVMDSQNIHLAVQLLHDNILLHGLQQVRSYL